MMEEKNILECQNGNYKTYKYNYYNIFENHVDYCCAINDIDNKDYFVTKLIYTNVANLHAYYKQTVNKQKKNIVCQLVGTFVRTLLLRIYIIQRSFLKSQIKILAYVYHYLANIYYNYYSHKYIEEIIELSKLL